MYDRCSLSSIKGNITRAFAGPASTGKELTTTTCKAAFALLKSQSWSSSSELEKRLFQSAFYCLSLIVAKTQQAEDFFVTFIFKHEYWDKIIDCEIQMSFSQKLSNVKVTTLGRKGKNRIISRGLHNNILSTQSDDPLFLLSSLSQPQSQRRKEFSQAVVDDVFQTTFVPPSDDIEMAEIEDDEEVIQELTPVHGLDDVCIEMELKDFNNQSCMEALVRVSDLTLLKK